MKDRVTIHPPAPIPELLGANTKPQQIQAKLNSVKKIVRESTARAIPLTGTQIKNARKAKGWSQAKLAGLLGVSQRYISMFERGDRTPNSKLFGKIQKILDIH